MMLLILVLLRTALIDEWRSQLPDDIPNHFVMNVTPDQLPAVEAMLESVRDGDVEESGQRLEPLYPMIRGRIVGVNGTDAKAWEDEVRGSRAERDGLGLRSERNLTWTANVPEGNEVVGGAWWTPQDEASLVSLEDEYARELGLSLGDRLEFDIGGQFVEATVASLRTLDWESMQPNFFIIFSPAALRDFPATYMTSFHLPEGRKAFLNRLLSEFPTITVLEIDAIVEQVQSIIDRVTAAVELVLALVVGAGCLVLLASIRAGWDARMAEHALVRTLGGTRDLIAGSLAAEFVALGAFSGLVAVVGAELTVALLQWQVFELPAAAHPWLWLLGPLMGAVLIFAVGMTGARRLVSSPPLMVLRGAD